MATRRIFDGATIEIGQVPIVGAGVPPVASSKFWIKVAGVWKEAIVHIKVAGVWKTATVHIKVAGVWK
jgi:hypothetical protein